MKNTIFSDETDRNDYILIEKLDSTTLGQCANYAQHESVYEFQDSHCNLKGYIAIHNSRSGISTGGTRFYAYGSQQEALEDALNLSKQMTHKCAISGLPYGGAKAVIIGDPTHHKTPALLSAYAQIVAQLEGRFYTGADMGISHTDVAFLKSQAPYFVGSAEDTPDAASEYTSLSVYLLMKAAAKAQLQKTDLHQLRIGIKGLGKIGKGLLKLLAADQAQVFAADLNSDAQAEASKLYPNITFLSPESLFKQDLDIYVPCAFGNEFTRDNIHHLKTKIICGGANNQLVDDETGQQLHKRGILYVPDYLANAGALISVSDELEPGGYAKSRVLARIQGLATKFQDLHAEAQAQHQPLFEVTRYYAEAFLKQKPLDRHLPSSS